MTVKYYIIAIYIQTDYTCIDVDLQLSRIADNINLCLFICLSLIKLISFITIKILYGEFSKK